MGFRRESAGGCRAKEVFGMVLPSYLSYDPEILHVSLSHPNLALDVLKVDSRSVVAEEWILCPKMTRFSSETSS